jgi:hypothetical protein
LSTHGCEPAGHCSAHASGEAKKRNTTTEIKLAEIKYFIISPLLFLSFPLVSYNSFDFS